MNIQLDDWQKEVLAHKGDLLLCTGRRVGKTYIMARKAVDRMAHMKNCPIIIVSLTEDQAMIIMAMALNYAKDTYPKLIGKGKNKPTLRSMVVNGNKMVVRPVGNTGDGVRGFEGGVLYIDEASRMPKMFWVASLPIILTYENSEVWLSSTPFGKQGYFWEAFDEAFNKKKPDARFKVFYKSTQDVMQERIISESWTEGQRANALKRMEQDRQTMSDKEYGQEYMGLFLDELQRYFSDDLIEAVCTLKRRESILRGRLYSLGVDIARMGNDASSFSILHKINQDTYEQVEQITTRKTLTTQTEERIVFLNKQWEFEKIFIDAGSGSLGVGVFDHLLKNEETKRKVIAINNRMIAITRDGKRNQRLMKEDLYDNLRYLMQAGKIKLLNDDEIKRSFESVQYEFVSDEKGLGHMRIFAIPSADIVESLVRAAWISQEKSLNLWVKSIQI